MKKNNIIYVKKTIEIDQELYHQIKVKVVSDNETLKSLIDRLLRDYIKHANENKISS